MLPTLPNVKKIQMKTGKLKVFISINLISVLTIQGDDQFPAKLSTVHGEVPRMQRLSLTKSQAIQHFFIVSKLSCNLSTRAKYSKTLKRTFSKKHSKIEEENDIFYSISLKYTTQDYSYKNQMFLRLKYMPA